MPSNDKQFKIVRMIQADGNYHLGFILPDGQFVQSHEKFDNEEKQWISEHNLRRMEEVNEVRRFASPFTYRDLFEEYADLLPDSPRKIREVIDKFREWRSINPEKPCILLEYSMEDDPGYSAFVSEISDTGWPKGNWYERYDTAEAWSYICSTKLLARAWRQLVDVNLSDYSRSFWSFNDEEIKEIERLEESLFSLMKARTPDEDELQVIMDDS